ncbi:hypothetical protein C8234_14655 [Paracidovorax avenae]|uniref:hypothetical protein n=1 Tax=Paracidovorax avenae TaxID=80867 RepID=UPI000D2108A4|nr:hypothetical protein [Paracidovorax avenae]AVS79184.1 hypothetical protein C8234_14655 [Paracidovorax avenae]
MGILDTIADLVGNRNPNYPPDSQKSGAIDYGKQKNDGSHDHRYNKGEDRTPAQKQGDKRKGKNESDE